MSRGRLDTDRQRNARDRDRALAASRLRDFRPAVLVLNAGPKPPIGPLPQEQSWKGFIAPWNSDVKAGSQFCLPPTAGRCRPVRRNPPVAGRGHFPHRPISRTLALDERAIGDSGPGRCGEGALRGASVVAVLCTLQRCRVSERARRSNARARIGGRDDAVGLVPSSPKGDVARGGCARVPGDALLSSADFRTAWLNGQRGIVPLAGFYVWQRTQAGYRQPHYVRLVNRLVFGVAVLWDRSVTDDDDVVESCALMTVPANSLLAEIDNSTTGQMPAILRREDYDTWLRSSVAEASRLLRTYPQTRMLSHPVAPHVNHLEFDEPWLIQPAPREPVQ